MNVKKVLLLGDEEKEILVKAGKLFKDIKSEFDEGLVDELDTEAASLISAVVEVANSTVGLVG